MLKVVWSFIILIFSINPNPAFILIVCSVQVASKKDFNDCTGFEESDEGESGPVTVSFDKVLRHHTYDSDYDDDPLKSEYSDL